MLAESRNVGYAFTWARPPVDFFGSLTATYFDGGDLVFKQTLGDGLPAASYTVGDYLENAGRFNCRRL